MEWRRLCLPRLAGTPPLEVSAAELGLTQRHLHPMSEICRAWQADIRVGALGGMFISSQDLPPHGAAAS